jgi:hypothetical protein
VRPGCSFSACGRVRTAHRARFPISNRAAQDTAALGVITWFRGGPMFDLFYVVLIAVLFVISIAMIRFFDRI